MAVKNEPFAPDQQAVIDRFINGEIEIVERYWPLHGYFEESRATKITVTDAKPNKGDSND